MSKRSAFSLSSSKHFSKLSVSFSPKNVMSGWAAVSERRNLYQERDDLHYPRWEQRIILLVITVQLAAALWHAFGRLSRPISGINAAFAQGHLSLHNFLLDDSTRHADAAFKAGGSCKRSMTLQDISYADGSLERVDILCVVLCSKMDEIGIQIRLGR
jgi:hypothetical protein